jgi:hypothetical protein
MSVHGIIFDFFYGKLPLEFIGDLFDRNAKAAHEIQ